MSDIKASPGNTYPEEIVKGWSFLECVHQAFKLLVIAVAVQRKYEALRRLWQLDEKEDCNEMKKENAVKKKYRQRRKRVCYNIRQLA